VGNSPLYVVGDVHGRLDLLMAIDREIATDAAGGAELPFVILVGDVVDRGEESAGGVDYVLERQARDERFFCICGNHEALMLDFLQKPSPRHKWLALGGTATLASYGLDIDHVGRNELTQMLRRRIPSDHVRFLQELPLAIETEQAFVSHAGIRPGRGLAAQEDMDLMWFRDGMSDDYTASPKLIVHGHDPQPEGKRRGQRINVDTGAYATGVLTAARLGADGAVRFFTARATRSALNQVLVRAGEPGPKVS
jgi:serine/threonine protein phosphatase 1